MAPNWNVYNQFVIQYKHIYAQTNQYQSIHTNIYCNTQNNIGLQVGITRIVFEYMQNTYLVHTITYQNTCQYLYCWAKTSVLNRNSIHAITYQIHANTYHDTYQYQIGSAHGFSPHLQVLACIVVCIGMYCARIWHVLCNDTSKSINTYPYVQYIPFFLYILANMLKCMQYIPYIPMLANTGKYSQIHINTDTYRQHDIFILHKNALFLRKVEYPTQVVEYST